MSNFNAFDATRFNSYRDSGFNARGRNALFLVPDQSGGTDAFAAGFLGDGYRFYAYSPTVPTPDFSWSLTMAGEPDEGWGRKSFTIRLWWRSGATAIPGAPLSSAIWNIERMVRVGPSPSFRLDVTRNFRRTGAIITGLPQVVEIPTTRFQVWGNGPTLLGSTEYHFWQSPAPGLEGWAANSPPGGVIGPLIEMTEDTWHRTIIWYDEDTLEIGLQLDNLAPEIATLSGPIPAGPTQGLTMGNDPFSHGNIDLTLDEIGLWHDYVWTEDEREADWNDGDGTGWPGVLSTVSRPPMAYWRLQEADDTPDEGIASVV